MDKLLVLGTVLCALLVSSFQHVEDTLLDDEDSVTTLQDEGSGDATTTTPTKTTEGTAPPPPAVTIGVPEREGRCGRVLSITCTASVVDNLAATPSFMWTGPDDAIVATDNTLDLATLSTSTGVYMCEACVSVASVGIDNICGSTSVSIQDTTPEPVSDVTCTSLFPSTLVVSWSPPTSPVLSYQVEVRRYVVVEQRVSTVPLASPFDQSEVVTTAMIDNLVGSVRYEVLVEAVSSVGCSTVTTLDCYTEEGVPPVVTGVTTDRLTGTAINVSWTPPNKAQSNGFIQNYTVTYSTVMESTNRRRQGSRMVTVPSDRSDVVIGGLDPESAYAVGVAATTTKGTSELSRMELTPAVAPADSNTAAVVGGVVGGLFFVLLLILAVIAIVMCRRRRNKGIIYKSTESKFDLPVVSSTPPLGPSAEGDGTELKECVLADNTVTNSCSTTPLP